MRLSDGALEISPGKPPEQAPGAGRLRDVCALAAVQALKDYLEGTVDQPFAPLDEIFIELLLTEPETFASPLPSLARTLRGAGLGTSGGSVGIGGTAWNLARIRGLDRAEVVAGTMALGLLLTWIDEDPEHGPSLLRDYTHSGLTERFLRARGGWLRDDERELAESWQHIRSGSSRPGTSSAAWASWSARCPAGSRSSSPTGCSPPRYAGWSYSAATGMQQPMKRGLPCSAPCRLGVS